MWTKGNYRRNLLDMHIADWDESFLSKVDCEEYVNALKEAGFQAAMVKAKPHTGLCFWPSTIGRMHKGLKGRDYLGKMIELCHKNDIAVITYFTQIFDNWAYENNPSWRIVSPDGMNYMEYREGGFLNGRYGLVCPNNPDYRAYVKANLQELNRNYDFEGMFLDMTCWPDICLCTSCRERYLKETGKEIPRTIDWRDPEFKAFQALREDWLTDYAVFAANAVKEIKPHVTIEHQLSPAIAPWIHGSAESITAAIDYAGGDFYGSYLQQSFICKMYRNISPTLPFVFHGSRCDPNLTYHTTTKTKDELMLQVITALVHDGAFILVDAIDPDGSIVTEVYTNVMKGVFDKTAPYEKYVGGDFISDVDIWYASYSKYVVEDAKDIKKRFELNHNFRDTVVDLSSILREYHVPFDIIGSEGLKTSSSKVIFLSNIASIKDDEMDSLESYVKNGGCLYISGNLGHQRLYDLLEAECAGETEHDFTYISPTKEGEIYFEGFTKRTSLTIPMKQKLINFKGEHDVLATVTLPYTLRNTGEFSAIHANPPGIYTENAACIRKKVGRGTILWVSAPIENTKPFMSRRTVYNLIKMLAGTFQYAASAPAFVETVGWIKNGKTYIALINQQEASPVAPMYDIQIILPHEVVKAKLLGSDTDIEVSTVNGQSVIKLPRLDIFHMIEI